MNKIQEFYFKHSQNNLISQSHINYLISLKNDGFEPRVIYDIGACVLHWTHIAKQIWPDAEIILFEANPYCEFLYSGYKYYSGILSDKNDLIKFYLNEYAPEGSSYYREIGHPKSAELFPEERYYYLEANTLDNIVIDKQFPLPDFIKMDIQGSEYDVCRGGTKTLAHAKQLILELPKPGVQYNKDAPSAEMTTSLLNELGWKCCASLFSDNGPYDGDYGFTKN